MTEGLLPWWSTVLTAVVTGLLWGSPMFVGRLSEDNPGMFLDMNDILSRVDVEQSLKREKEALALGPVLAESAEIVIA